MSGAVGHDRALAERYALERELGRGGMGVVYLATDLRHGRAVAIKFLPAELASAVGSARFDQEIDTLAKLTHPHILPLHDSGEADGELYFVMPHVEGESLRQRLDRDGAMRVGVALRIARQVADALAYAHSRGIVHRDIKPENVLLDRQGNAWVSDFGIARVLEQAGNDATRLTTAGIRVGSPHYMSPEQIAGERDLDGRSDIYALGCVLFEMLAGEPPFSPRGAQAVMRGHLVDPPPSVRKRRADVAPSIERMLDSMLAKDPEARVATADLLGAALDAEIARTTGDGPVPMLLAPGWRRNYRIAAGAILLLVVLGFLAMAYASGNAEPVANRHAIMATEWTAAEVIPAEGSLDELIREAFGRWDGLDIAEPAGRARSASASLRLARDLEAGRYVRSVATPNGDFIRLNLTLHDAATGSALRSVVTRVPTADSATVLVRLAVDSLLFGRVTWGATPDTDIGTRSYDARSAYAGAFQAIDAWELDAADSLLNVSIAADPGFARAQYWLAQVRAWRGDGPESWTAQLNAGLRYLDELEEQERSLASALQLLSARAFPQACAAYAVIRSEEPRSTAAAIGLAECQRNDSLVVRDRSSPSGWRFRGSTHAAQMEYARAFSFAPAFHRAFRSDTFRRLRDGILYTRSNRARLGWDRDGTRYAAYPQWLGDSLAFIPHVAPYGEPLPAPAPAAGDDAILRQRQLFRDLARAWVSADPHGPDALLALALSMEMLGNPAAIDTIRAARRYATQPGDHRRLAIREVWLLLKFETHRESSLIRLRLVADSLLDDPQALTSGMGRDLAAIALLLGRPAAAAEFARTDPEGITHIASRTAMTRPAVALLAFAALGGPADSIAEFEHRTEAAIRNTVPADEQHGARMTLLERPAFLAFPAPALGVLRGEDPLRTYVAIAQRLWLHGHADSVRIILAGLTDGGTPDVTYAFARLAVLAGEDDIAVRLLVNALDDLPWAQPGTLEHVAHAGALVRSMALLAELSAAAGDAETARRWSSTVSLLWADSEPHVRSSLEQMNLITAD